MSLYSILMINHSYKLALAARNLFYHLCYASYLHSVCVAMMRSVHPSFQTSKAALTMRWELKQAVYILTSTYGPTMNHNRPASLWQK